MKRTLLAAVFFPVLVQTALLDTHDTNECSSWAAMGECTKNQGFMLQNCALSCHKVGVEKQAYAQRCPEPENHKQALEPGALPGVFDRIMQDFKELQPEMVSKDPPVVVFNNFLSAEEADALREHGSGRYSPSLTVGPQGKGEVASPIRTSSHAWCKEEACLQDPLVKSVSERVANVTQTPETNAEYAMLVYYHACNDPADPECAFYRRHSDYIPYDRNRLQGVRIFTLYCYLNDVTEGGGTRLTDIPGQPTVQPRKGKAALWSSVLADSPHTMDSRTHHEALPVTKGEKFGAVFWIHQHDFRGPHARGCTAD